MDRYYVGSTEDMSTRLKEHLWKHSGFTSKASDWELVYEEKYETKKAAYARERAVKRKKSRKYLEYLISTKDSKET